MRVLVAYSSADGSTSEIAQRLACRLDERGHEATVRPAGSVDALDRIDAVVLGSAIHGRQWLDDATTFVNTHRKALQDRPFWTFSVGMPDALPRLLRKIARTEETAIIANLGDLQPAGHHLFSGVVKASQFPFVSRVFLRLAGGQYGDFRDWAAIDRWATEIGGQLETISALDHGASPRSGADPGPEGAGPS